MKKRLTKLLTKILQPKVNLIDSIIHDKIADIRLAIENGGTDFNFSKLYGNNSYIYPLLTAVYFEKHEIAKMMLQQGRANPNYGMNSFPYFLFSDPNLHFSSMFRTCPLPDFNVLDWNSVNAGVLSFVTGKVKMLELVLEHGGSVSNFYRGGRSFLKYFLENSCSIRMCILLCKYQQFSLSDTEQEVFTTAYLRHDDQGDKSPSYKKGVIFDILEQYGFSVPTVSEREMIVGYESSSSETGQPEFIRRYFRLSTFQHGERNQRKSGKYNKRQSQSIYHEEDARECLNRIIPNERQEIFKLLNTMKKGETPFQKYSCLSPETPRYQKSTTTTSNNNNNNNGRKGDGGGYNNNNNNNNKKNKKKLIHNSEIVHRSILRRRRKSLEDQLNKNNHSNDFTSGGRSASASTSTSSSSPSMYDGVYFSWTTHSDT